MLANPKLGIGIAIQHSATVEDLNLALICRRPVKRMAAAASPVRRKTFSMIA